MDLNISTEELEELDRIVDEAHSDSNNLPMNSNALILNETTSRFSSAEWFNEIQKQTVLLAGIGGIGSHLAFMLSRVKVGKLILYDPDVVDHTNLSGQLYTIRDTDSSKTSAIRRHLINFSEYFNILAFTRAFNYDSPANKIMMCGFDNMEARKAYFSVWKNYVDSLPEEERCNCLFIDGRLAAEEFQIFCIKGTDYHLMKKYEKNWLFSDSEAEETLCSYKQTSFCANMIASIMTNLFVNFVANKCNPVIERDLPFYIEYNAERMYLKTEMQ